MALTKSSFQVQFLFLGLFLKLVETLACVGTCYGGNWNLSPNIIIHNKKMSEFSYKKITAKDEHQCYAKCIQDCRCSACQMSLKVCELLDFDRKSKPTYFVDAHGFIYMDLDQHLYQGESHSLLSSSQCYNGCCKSRPCMNGGTCVEQCQSPNEKFRCNCPNSHTGRVCEKLISECHDIKKYSSPGYKTQGKYIITRSDNGHKIALYCHILEKMSWTLIESFSRENNHEVKSKAFSNDAPLNSAEPNWVLYRLSLNMMKYLRLKSTFFVATCSFDKKTKQEEWRRDYIKASLKQFDPFKPVHSNGICFNASFVNIRGHEYKDVIVPIWQHPVFYHAHLDAATSQCWKQPVPESVHSEDVFGFYHAINDKSTCLNDNSATTNWWLGRSN